MNQSSSVLALLSHRDRCVDRPAGPSTTSGSVTKAGNTRTWGACSGTVRRTAVVGVRPGRSCAGRLRIPSRSCCSHPPSCHRPFFGAALMWGATHAYLRSRIRRWWLVHLWGRALEFRPRGCGVDFHRLGLTPGTATAENITVLFATIVFMAGGVLGDLASPVLCRMLISVVALAALAH